MLLKIIQFSGQTLRHTKQVLRNKIVPFKKIYKFHFDHFLIKRTVFILIVKNVIKNQKFNFPDKLCDIRNKCEGTKFYLHQNAKGYEARNTEREARDENVRTKRADFFMVKDVLL